MEAVSGRSRVVMPIPDLFRMRELAWSWLGVLADVSAAQAVGSMLPADTAIRTVGLRLDTIGDLPAVGVDVTAVGTSMAVDEHYGLGRATLIGPGGTAIAVCTARFAVVGVSVDEARSTIDGLTPPGRPIDIDDLFGSRVESISDGRAVMVAHPSKPVSNHVGIVHGGLHAVMADRVMREALPSSRMRMLDLTVGYQRPITVADDESGAVMLRADLERTGRRVTTVRARIESSSGRLLTNVFGTYSAT
ncbi:hypothetical protein GCM10023197_26040 [Gordonia humi]